MYAMKNKVQLIGNLGQPPHTEVTEAGVKMVHFAMATNEKYLNKKGEKVTETMWHQIVATGKLADVAEKYLVKGIEVAVEGKLVNRNYTDERGFKHYITEVWATDFLILNTNKKAY